MPLSAKKPEPINKRLKLFMYGPAGVGKTTACIQFPNAVILDLEKGTENYSETILKANSIVLKTNDPDEVHQELRTLLTETHQYKTLIIDPITSLYNGIQEKWNRIFEKYATSQKQSELQDYGMRFWGKVKSNYKSIQRILMALDMNVIVTSHQKDIYGSNMNKIGVGPDAMKGDEYFFDYVFQLNAGSDKNKRMAKTVKERAEIGKPKFPEVFEWSYDNFLRYYGSSEIKRDSVPMKLATKEQIKTLENLLNTVRIDDKLPIRWLDKAGVDSWIDMREADIQKCIDYMEKKLGGKK